MSKVTFLVRPGGAPQVGPGTVPAQRSIQGTVVERTATHVIVAVQGQDGEVYRTVRHEQVTECKEIGR